MCESQKLPVWTNPVMVRVTLCSTLSYATDDEHALHGYRTDALVDLSDEHNNNNHDG